ELHADRFKRVAGRVVAGVFHPDRIAGREQRIDAKPDAMLGAADDHHAARITPDTPVCREMLGDFRPKVLTAARIAVAELIAARGCDPAPDIAGQTAQQRGIRMPVSERKGASFSLRDLE